MLIDEILRNHEEICRLVPHVRRQISVTHLRYCSEETLQRLLEKQCEILAKHRKERPCAA